MSRLSITSRLTFFFSVEIYLRRDIYQDCRDKSRLLRFIETFKIYQEFSRFLDIIETFLRLQAQKSWQIEKSRSRNVITLTNSRSRSRQTVEICQKCHVSKDFSVLIKTFWTFWTFRTCRGKIEISRSLRLTFWNCQYFLDCRDWLFFGVETNRDPQGYVEIQFRYLNRKTNEFRFHTWLERN